MAHNLKKIVWLVILALIIAWIVYSLASSYWARFPYATYRLNDEIKGFPIDGISVTFTNYSITPDIGFPKDSEDVNVNVIVRNLTNQTFNFNQLDFQEKFYEDAGSKELTLYFYVNGTQKGGVGSGDYRSWWGIKVSGKPMNELGSLEANGSVYGSIRFMQRTANYTSFDLLCTSSSQQKPLFIVGVNKQMTAPHPFPSKPHYAILDQAPADPGSPVG